MPDKGKQYRGNRRTMLKSMAVGGMALAAGCTGGEESPAAGDDDDTGTDEDLGGHGHWIAPQSSEAPNYNVYQVTDTTSGARIARVKDPSYVFDDNDEFVYLTVRDIDVNDDNTEFTFTLTEHGEWSDPYGSMTAEDWVYSITEVIQGDDNWAAVSMADDWRMSVDEIPDGFDPVDEDEEQAWFNVEETGEYEFTVETPEPQPGFIYEPMANFEAVMPKDLLEPYVEDQDGTALDEDSEVQSLEYVGNLGAFDIQVLETEARMHATRAEDYYLRNYDDHEDTPVQSEWTYQVMREESTRLSSLQSGEVTTAGIPARRADEFEDMDDIDVYSVDTQYCQSMFYNMRDDGWEPLQEKEVRQALTMAVDRNSMVEDIEMGRAVIAHTLMPEWGEFYDDSQVVEFDYDPEAAREQLEENLTDPYQYSDGRVVDGDGDEVVLNFTFGDAAESTELMARFIQEEFDENLGIDVELNPVPWNTMLDDYLYADNAYDLMAGIGRNAWPRNPESTEGYWRPGETANGYGYDDPEGVADMLSEASLIEDQDERGEILADVLGILSEEQPWNFLYFPDDIIGYRDHVEPTEDESWVWGWDQHSWEIDDEQA